VIVVLEEIVAHKALGLIDLPVDEHAVGGDNLDRQTRQPCDILGRIPGVGLPARHPIQHAQCPPARGQCRIQHYRVLEGLDGGRRGSHGDMAVSALLKQAGILRVQPLEALERLQGIGNPLQVALGDRHYVQHVAVLRHFREQRPRGSQRRLELAPLEQPADTVHLRLDARGGRVDDRSFHRAQRGGVVVCRGFYRSSPHGARLKPPGWQPGEKV